MPFVAAKSSFMRPPVNISAFGLAALLAAMLVTTATPVSSDMGLIIDAEWLMQDCDEFVPESLSVNGITDDGEVTTLDVMVLIDAEEGAEIATIGLDEEREEEYETRLAELVERAERDLAPSTGSYEAIAIELRYSGYDLLLPLNEDLAPRDRTDHAGEIIGLAKEQFGGERPDGFDLVYVLTDLDIQLPDIGNAVVGMADCIGGVRYPDRAFAVGEWENELIPNEGFQFGPVAVYREFAAKIAGHELGHLMGAHHHYQTCGDVLPAALADGDLGPCSLMTNAIDFQSFPFSQLSGAVVRGHALDFGGVGGDQDDHDH